MRTAEERLRPISDYYGFTNRQNQRLTQLINEARIEAIKECAEAAKIVRYTHNPFGSREDALLSQKRDFIDKQSILKLIDQVK